MNTNSQMSKRDKNKSSKRLWKLKRNVFNANRIIKRCVKNMKKRLLIKKNNKNKLNYNRKSLYKSTMILKMNTLP